MSELDIDIEILNRICETPIVHERRAPYGAVGKGFRDLRVWQGAMDLVEACYRASQSFPASEQSGSVNQLRRAAVSIPSNIAEGWGRNTQPEFARFVDISIGSLCEVESLIEVSKRLEFLLEGSYSDILESANKVGSMQYRLRAALKR